MSTKKILIFGSDPAALITGLQYQRQGHRVELFDPGQHFQYENPRFFSPELAFWPSSDDNFNSLAWLEKLLEMPLGGVEADLQPLTFQNDQLTSFVGFGDKTYSSIPALSLFNRRAQLRLNLSERQIYQRVREMCQFEIHEFSEVSQIRLSGNGIESVQINGNKDCQADHFVFGQTPRTLIELAPSDFFAPRMLSRLARTPVFGQLSLDVPASQSLTAEPGQMIFLLPPQNDQEPVVGQLYEGRSLWQSYLPSEKAEDPEAVASLFRNMRRLIEKHLPQLADHLRMASIHMTAEGLADYPREEAWESFKKSNNNVSLASPLWSAQYGLLAATEVAHLVTDEALATTSPEATPSSLQV